MKNSNRSEESKFMGTVREVNVRDVPKGSNVVTSHVICTVKSNDDGSLKIKSRITPHGIKDKERS